MSSSTAGVEDALELMQHIQMMLPVKEAARTSVLAKSWLHAWSTIPTLRFRIVRGMDMKFVDMERTLIRYLHNNIPIETFDLEIDIDKNYKESLSLVENCIRITAMATTLKELSFSFQPLPGPVILPDEILSCKNLTKIRVSYDAGSYHCPLDWSYHHVPGIISCSSLRQLYLVNVNISQDRLDAILSSCRLLVKIEIIDCSRYLNIIKVKNLPFLSELKISTLDQSSTAVEINHVPNLRWFHCNLCLRESNPVVPFTPHSISLMGSCLTELILGEMMLDYAFLGMITSGVHFLESLTISMGSWESQSFHFTCASIKRLTLHMCPQSLIEVKVYAPNLLFFCYDGPGNPMPSLLFPVSTMINQTMFWVRPRMQFHASFFIKLKEAFAISSNCHLHVFTFGYKHGQRPPLDINIDDDLRTSPAMNVKRLSFRIPSDECMWEHSPFIDAFFEICHPNYVTLRPDMPLKLKDHFCKLMLRVVLEKTERKSITARSWPRYLKHVEIRCRQKWETLRKIHRRNLPVMTRLPVEFKLIWH